jgi:hypothetical protein
MPLQLLHDTVPVAAYYDAHNDWLFADWRGELNLDQVQAGCLTLAQCFLERTYTRVLNSNCDVTHMSAEAPVWLARDYLPHLGLAGIEYLAWVCAPSLLLKHFASEAVGQLQTPTVAMFDDVADAYTWLQHTHLGPGVPAVANRHSRLRNRVEALSDELHHYQQVARLVGHRGAAA